MFYSKAYKQAQIGVCVGGGGGDYFVLPGKAGNAREIDGHHQVKVCFTGKQTPENDLWGLLSIALTSGFQRCHILGQGITQAKTSAVP